MKSLLSTGKKGAEVPNKGGPHAESWAWLFVQPTMKDSPLQTYYMEGNEHPCLTLKFQFPSSKMNQKLQQLLD